LFSRSTSGINLNRKYIPPAMKLDNLWILVLGLS
jgi:hypothetical protein